MLVSGKQVAVSGEKGGSKDTLETPAWEANLDLLERTIPRRQDHSQTIHMVIHCFIIDDHGQLPWFKMIQQW